MRPGRPRHLSLLDALRLRHRRLGRDEGGQVMLMTAILALAFIMFVASILPVGQTITARIQAQNAADAAATMAVTSSWNVCVGFQPSIVRAFEASPSVSGTSAGRSSCGSETTRSATSGTRAAAKASSRNSCSA